MESINWSDQTGSRGRGAWLLFIKGDEVIVFHGENIPGVVAVRGTSYTKQGKWSHNTYRLELASGIRHIAGRDGWETGRFVESLGVHDETWPEVAKALGVSVPGAMVFLRAWRPGAAKKLDEIEAFLIALEEATAQQETDSVMVTVSFGSPSNRAAREGYWESPKGIPGYGAEIRLKDREQGWNEGNIEVVGIAGTVLTVKHSSGMHGGYYAVSIAVVPGTEIEIPPFETARETAAKESGIPEQLYLAFDGEMELARTLMKKAAKLDVSKLDEHEMSCGRARKQAEVIRASGDPDFFLGADPLEVCWYITEGYSSNDPASSSPDSSGSTAFADALRKAGLA